MLFQDHFERGCIVFDKGKGKHFLKPDAVPTLFGGPDQLQARRAKACAEHDHPYFSTNDLNGEPMVIDPLEPSTSSHCEVESVEHEMHESQMLLDQIYQLKQELALANENNVALTHQLQEANQKALDLEG